MGGSGLRKCQWGGEAGKGQQLVRCVIEPLNTVGNGDSGANVKHMPQRYPRGARELGGAIRLPPQMRGTSHTVARPRCDREYGGQRPSGKDMLVLAVGGQQVCSGRAKDEGLWPSLLC